MNLFSEVAALLTRREQKKTEDFDSLVKAVADGGKKGPTVSQIAERLEALGSTAADLEAEVTRRQQRRDYAAVLVEVPSLEQEKVELERRGAAEVARYNALVEPLRLEHQRTIDGLNGRYRFVVDRIPQAQSMRGKLVASYRGPLEQELVENRIRRGELERAICLAVKNAERCEHDAAFVKRDESADQMTVVREAGQVVGFVSGTERWAKKADAKDISCLPPDELATALASAKSYRSDADRMRAEVAVLEKRAGEIAELMLQP